MCVCVCVSLSLFLYVCVVYLRVCRYNGEWLRGLKHGTGTLTYASKPSDLEIHCFLPLEFCYSMLLSRLENGCMCIGA